MALVVMPCGAELAGERASETGEPALRRDIGRVIGAAERAGDRGHQDDPPAAARQHQPDSRLGEMEGRRQIDVEHALEFLRLDLAERPAVADADVADEDVEAAEITLEATESGRHRLGIGDVEGERRGLVPGTLQASGRGGEALAIAAVENHLSAGLRQRRRDLEAEALGGTGDQRHLAVEGEGVARGRCPLNLPAASGHGAESGTSAGGFASADAWTSRARCCNFCQ